MKTISFSMPDDYAVQVTTAMCATYGYSATVPDPDNPGKTLPNPQTPGEFAQQQVVKFCLEVLKAYLVQQAAEAARTEAAAGVDKNIDLSQVKVEAN